MMRFCHTKFENVKIFSKEGGLPPATATAKKATPSMAPADATGHAHDDDSGHDDDRDSGDDSATDSGMA